MPRVISAIALGGLLFIPLSARADPITITIGRLYFDSGGPPVFNFGTAAPDEFSGIIFGLETPPGSVVGCACRAGDIVSLSAAFPGSAEVLATVGGVDAPGVAYRVMWTFTTPNITVVGQPLPAFVQETSFRFTGSLRAYSDDTLTDLLYEVPMTGGGTASVEFDQGGPPYSTIGPFFWEQTTFTFASPVPEPGTLALLGTGLLSACVAERRRRRRAAACSHDGSTTAPPIVS